MASGPHFSSDNHLGLEGVLFMRSTLCFGQGRSGVRVTSSSLRGARCRKDCDIMQLINNRQLLSRVHQVKVSKQVGSRCFDRYLPLFATCHLQLQSALFPSKLLHATCRHNMVQQELISGYSDCCLSLMCTTRHLIHLFSCRICPHSCPPSCNQLQLHCKQLTKVCAS